MICYVLVLLIYFIINYYYDYVLRVEVAVFRVSNGFKSKFNFYQNESMRGNALTVLCTKVVLATSTKI